MAISMATIVTSLSRLLYKMAPRYFSSVASNISKSIHSEYDHIPLFPYFIVAHLQLFYIFLDIVEPRIVCSITGAYFLCFYTRVEESFQCYSPAPSWRCLVLWGILDTAVYGIRVQGIPQELVLYHLRILVFLTFPQIVLPYSYISPLLKFICHFLPVHIRCVNLYYIIYIYLLDIFLPRKIPSHWQFLECFLHLHCASE